MGLVFPLVLNSPDQVYPCGKVLEVFWGVFEGYTRPRVLVELFGKSLFSGLLSRHHPRPGPQTPGGVTPPQESFPTAESYPFKAITRPRALFFGRPVASNKRSGLAKAKWS